MLLRDTVIKVDLDDIAYNMDLIRKMAGSAAVMPVIKANGYGHGAVPIAATLMKHGASYLAVATLTEALELREAWPDYPLFILGHTPDRLLPLAAENRIVSTIFSIEQGRILSDLACKTGRSVKAHLKVDTGFHRLGATDLRQMAAVCRLPGLDVEGIFSHLALAGSEENEKQYRQFCAVIQGLEKEGITFRYHHLADSISAVDDPKYRMDMIRPGALVFGLRGFHKGFLPVRQALTFETRISQIHRIRKGEGVGYDYLWTAPADTRIGTLPFGYADGYPRSMRGKGYVTIRGVKCPVVGVICMDQCMVDLAGVPEAREGDRAVIYGNGRNNTMSIAEAAELAGTNKNEIVSRLAARPPRVYIAGGSAHSIPSSVSAFRT
ncbi:alanine racemase [Bacilliculturomica massiliensis]|uniref:alanine racemase n=1 Tax=Bacilliculturomica massiliensis TaxID=1917867 RepID=UPI001030176F|nr:alanine racemase [Bacilliculturomica massiliensis]